jgi:hypothetical protein
MISFNINDLPDCDKTIMVNLDWEHDTLIERIWQQLDCPLPVAHNLNALSDILVDLFWIREKGLRFIHTFSGDASFLEEHMDFYLLLIAELDYVWEHSPEHDIYICFPYELEKHFISVCNRNALEMLDYLRKKGRMLRIDAEYKADRTLLSIILSSSSDKLFRHSVAVSELGGRIFLRTVSFNQSIQPENILLFQLFTDIVLQRIEPENNLLMNALDLCMTVHHQKHVLMFKESNQAMCVLFDGLIISVDVMKEVRMIRLDKKFENLIETWPFPQMSIERYSDDGGRSTSFIFITGLRNDFEQLLAYWEKSCAGSVLISELHRAIRSQLS